jgi:hypothetical protein
MESYTKRRKYVIMRQRKSKIREQVGSTERIHLKEQREGNSEEEPAEMDRGNKARIQGQKTVASVRATGHKYNLRTARRPPSRFKYMFSLMMGTAISVSETSLWCLIRFKHSFFNFVCILKKYHNLPNWWVRLKCYIL